MQVDRDALAKAYHRMMCISGDCAGEPDEADYHLADMANDALAGIPPEAITL